jgi:hypothetical protein
MRDGTEPPQLDANATPEAPHIKLCVRPTQASRLRSKAGPKSWRGGALPPVLARGVHPLQAEQNGAPAIGVKELLERSQLLLVLLDLVRRLLVALVVVFEARVDLP